MSSGAALDAVPPLNETVGLQHMKLYLYDDTVLISGANLSEDYFVNRQDRFVKPVRTNYRDDFIPR